MNRELRFVTTEEIDTSNIPHVSGSNAQCLADACLDILQVGLNSGMSWEDVDKAMDIIQHTLANEVRARFKLHIKDGE